MPPMPRRRSTANRALPAKSAAGARSGVALPGLGSDMRLRRVWWRAYLQSWRAQQAQERSAACATAFVIPDFASQLAAQSGWHDGCCGGPDMNAALNPTLKRLLRLCRMDRVWVRGQGAWLIDESGRRFLDGYAQYGAVAFDHNAPAVKSAMRAALDEDEPAMVQPYRARHAEALAEKLVRAAPGMAHCVFTTSGAETVEAAIKLVRS